MKRVISISFCLAPLWLSACAGNAPTAPGTSVVQGTASHRTSSERNIMRLSDGAGSVVIEKLPFRSGTSSVTVEKLAQIAGCSGPAAGLITEKGPVEVYRMQCDDGRTFMARCELRQCQPMR